MSEPDARFNSRTNVGDGRMHVNSFRCCILVLALTLGTCRASVAAPGASALLAVSVQDNGSLAWYSQQDGGATEQLGTFGVVGDHLVPGAWLAPGARTIGTVHPESGGLRWSVKNGADSERTFTLGTSSSLVVGGADVDHSGLLDAITVRERVKSPVYVWSVLKDPGVLDGGVVKEFQFGRRGDRPFFIDPDGTGDRLAVARQVAAGGVTVLWRSFNSSAVTIRRFPRARAFEGSPLPVRSPAGGDVIVLVTKRTDGTYRISGYKPASGKPAFPSRTTEAGTIIIGDVIPDAPGEEIGVVAETATTVTMINPWSQASAVVALPSRIPVDDININSFSGDRSVPPAVSCSSRDPRDGWKSGFIWKPNSDTQQYAVAVLPPDLTGNVAAVQVTTGSGEVIQSLVSKGAGNGNREAWQDRRFTGEQYQTTYGAVDLKVTLIAGGCITYHLDRPGMRID